jgi:ribose 5-phosphate isomerase A
VPQPQSDPAREAAARAAVERLEEGMTIGLGSGRAVWRAIELIGERWAGAPPFRAAFASDRTQELAAAAGIEAVELDGTVRLDVAIDGADEIDPKLRLIKGRGGALLREKIVEQAAKRFIVIADDSKLVERLGAGVLPVEVTPFALDVLTARFTAMGLKPQLRMQDGSPRVTDEGHRILDIRLPAHADIADVVAQVRENAGVVDTGFFPREATEAIIATSNGIRRMKR